MSFSGMLESQTWWRFVVMPLKFTRIELPPLSRASSWRGWWMSPTNWSGGFVRECEVGCWIGRESSRG